MKRLRFLTAALLLTVLLCLSAYAVKKTNEPVSVRAVLVSKLDDGRVIAPYACVRQDDEQQEYVYVWQQGEAHRRYIEPQSECADGFVLEVGLEDGDVLILTPDVISTDGERVSLAYS